MLHRLLCLRRLLLVLFAALCGVLVPGQPLPASAHAVLLRSEPAQNARLATAPTRLDLFFSEPLDHGFSKVQVRDTAGERQDKGDIGFTADPTELTASLPQLRPGFYTVTWTTVSTADGHRLDGTFPFTVLNPDGSTPPGTAPPVNTASASASVAPFDVVLRWLLLAGLIGITGGFGFALLVLYPAATVLAGQERATAHGTALTLLSTVVLTAALTALCINAAALLRQAAQDGSLGAVTQLLAGRTGTYWILRELLTLVAGALAWFLGRQGGIRDDRRTVVLQLVGLLIGFGTLLTMSLTGHAAAGGGSYWAVPSDVLHLIGVALWLGGLVQLPLLLRQTPALPAASWSRLLGAVLSRFSTLAVCCVGLVLLSGTFNALVQIPTWAALTDTAYGRALLVKLALLVPLLGLGLLNAVRIGRRVAQAGTAAAGVSERARLRLARTAVWESIAGALVIAATATLLFLVPAKDATAQAAAQKTATAAAPVTSVYRNETAADDLTVSLTVSPNRIGANEFRVLLRGPDIDQVQRVQLRFQFTGQQVGGSAVDANPDAATSGLFTATAANFSFVGRWRVAINVRRAGHDDINGGFTVEVPDATGATTTAALAVNRRSATAFPAHGITPQQAWGVLLVATGLLVFVFRDRLWRANHTLGITRVLGISGVVIVGLAVVATGRQANGQASPLINPVPADQRSVAAGKALYLANCAQCHGDSGHGDGPNAAALNPRPLDLTVHVNLHPDGQIFDWISKGVPRTAMPAWKNKLTDQERWDLLNYLRGLTTAASP